MKISIIKKLITFVEKHRNLIVSVQNLCGKPENEIAKTLFENLNVHNRKQSISYNGILGWGKYDPDGYFPCNSSSSDLVVEVKKVTEGSEYGYWHALVQGLIYSKRHHTKYKKVPCIICIILDWGRKAGTPLDLHDQDFIDYFIKDKIHTLRVSLVGIPFIEHNLNGHGKWTKL